jgi:uncharacterized protein DUF4007
MITATIDEAAGWTTRPGARVFSGHESFACRYGWLPKLHEAVTTDPTIFSSDEGAILALGLGRNMVKSIRFWGEAFGLTRAVGGEVRATAFASRLLDQDGGSDPYLETPGSLWRLHWMLTTHGGLGAWAAVFLDMHDPEIARERLVAVVRARAAQVRGPITVQTANTHVDMLIRTYAPAHEPEAVAEDALGSPFQELRLLRIVSPAGIPTIRLLKGPKPSLDPAALAFVLHDFWSGTAPDSRTLSMRSLMLSHGAPGSTLLLDEVGMHEGLDALCSISGTLMLRPDGAGGYDLTSSKSPLDELQELAW